MSGVNQDGTDGPIGHELVGTGPQRVVILHDWLCDTSTWDGARVFLDVERFTYAFVDLRGYGKSIERTGDYCLTEAAADVLKLADSLGWQQFAVLGHSMTTLVALHLAQQHADRIERAVVLTPPPIGGLGEAALEVLRALALADDAARSEQLAPQFAERLSAKWVAYKVERWRAAANPTAVAGYASMFTRDGLPNLNSKIEVPVLAVTGEQDAPPMRSEAVTHMLGELCNQLTVTPITDSGHYPMQELPPRTVALIEKFLGN